MCCRRSKSGRTQPLAKSSPSPMLTRCERSRSSPNAGRRSWRSNACSRERPGARRSSIASNPTRRCSARRSEWCRTTTRTSGLVPDAVPRPRAATAQRLWLRHTRQRRCSRSTSAARGGLPRFQLSAEMDVLVDGNQAVLANLSTLGAQLVSRRSQAKSTCPCGALRHAGDSPFERFLWRGPPSRSHRRAFRATALASSSSTPIPRPVDAYCTNIEVKRMPRAEMLNAECCFQLSS